MEIYACGERVAVEALTFRLFLPLIIPLQLLVAFHVKLWFKQISEHLVILRSHSLNILFCYNFFSIQRIASLFLLWAQSGFWLWGLSEFVDLADYSLSVWCSSILIGLSIPQAVLLSAFVAEALVLFSPSYNHNLPQKSAVRKLHIVHCLLRTLLRKFLIFSV